MNFYVDKQKMKKIKKQDKKNFIYKYNIKDLTDFFQLFFEWKFSVSINPWYFSIQFSQADCVIS